MRQLCDLSRLAKQDSCVIESDETVVGFEPVGPNETVVSLDLIGQNETVV